MPCREQAVKIVFKEYMTKDVSLQQSCTKFHRLCPSVFWEYRLMLQISVDKDTSILINLYNLD